MNSVKYGPPKRQFNKTMKKEIKNSTNPNKTENRIYKKICKIFILILMTFFTKL